MANFDASERTVEEHPHPHSDYKHSFRCTVSYLASYSELGDPQTPVEELLCIPLYHLELILVFLIIIIINIILMLIHVHNVVASLYYKGGGG